MKHLKRTFVVLFLFTMLTSCLTTKQTNLLKEPGGSIPSYPQAKALEEYRINAGDELSITLTFTENLSSTQNLFSLFSNTSSMSQGGSDGNKLRTLTVSPEGNIYFPFLGDIYVKGKNTLEVKEDIEKKLKERKILSEEEFCLAHVSLSNRYFSVIGESGTGRYSIAKEQMTIFQALSLSGDVNPYGDRAKVKVIRQVDKGTEVRSFDLRSADIVNSEYYYIQPNDVIYIQPLGRQFWGVNSFGAVFALISTVTSLGVFIYTLVDKQ